MIWDGKLRKYKVKRTDLISLDELMNTYGSYKTEKEAQTIRKGLNRKQGSEHTQESLNFADIFSIKEQGTAKQSGREAVEAVRKP